MAEDTRGWIVQPNPSATYTHEVEGRDENGNVTTETVEDFGQPQWAYRRPGDHVLVFSGVSADDEPPTQTVTEAVEASDFERPVPDSVAAADALAGSEAQLTVAEQQSQQNSAES